MDEQRCHARVGTKAGTFYTVVETVDEIRSQCEQQKWVELVSSTGQALMPPERLVLPAGEVVTIQEMSEAGWIWTQRATELHYARQLQDLESAPAERLANAQERLADMLTGDES